MRSFQVTAAHTTGYDTATKNAKMQEIITVKSEVNIRLQIRYAVIYF